MTTNEWLGCIYLILLFSLMEAQIVLAYFLTNRYYDQIRNADVGYFWKLEWREWGKKVNAILITVGMGLGLLVGISTLAYISLRVFGIW